MENTDDKDDGGRRPLVAGGIALFVLAIVLAALLVMYHRKRKGRVRYSDGPLRTNGDVSSSSSSSTTIVAHRAPSSLNATVRDPDDVQLLPSSEKLDMRSVAVSDDDTENYSMREYDDGEDCDADDGWAGRGYATGNATRDSNIVQNPTEDYSDDNAVVSAGADGTTSRRSSDLAAMGMASMLVTQSRK